MAKKKKKKDDAAAPSTSAAAQAAPATSPSPSSSVELAYQAGNYAAVQRLHKAAPQDHPELVERVRVDIVQVLVGAMALLVVAVIGLLVLK